MDAAAVVTYMAHMQEAACSSLGLLYSKRGEHAKAKDMFERNFMISRKVVYAGEDSGEDSVTTGETKAASYPAAGAGRS